MAGQQKDATCSSALRMASRLTLHFWAPRENKLYSHLIGAVRGVPPYIAFAIAPRHSRAAAIAADRDGMPTCTFSRLKAASSAKNACRRTSIGASTGRQWATPLGLYHFDPPYWHFSIYEAAGGAHRSTAA